MSLSSVKPSQFGRMLGADTFFPSHPEGSNSLHEPIDISSDDSLNDSSDDISKSIVDRIDVRTVSHRGPEPAANQSAYISRKRTWSTSHADDGGNPNAATPSSNAKSPHRPDVGGAMGSAFSTPSRKPQRPKGAKLKPSARAKSASTLVTSPPPTSRVDKTTIATAVPPPLAKRRRIHRRASNSSHETERVAGSPSNPTVSRMPGTWPSSPSSSEKSAQQDGSEGSADVEGLRAVLYGAADEVWAGSRGDGRVGGMGEGGNVDAQADHRVHDNDADLDSDEVEGDEQEAYDGDVEDDDGSHRSAVGAGREA